MRNLTAILSHTVRSWKHHFMLQLGSLVVITSALTIVFSIFMFFSNLEKTLISWGSEFDVNIFLKDNLKDSDVVAVQKNIQDLGYFQKIDFVGRKEATDKFFSKMSKYIPEFATEKANNKDFSSLIPASFVGSIHKKLNINELEKISANIEKITGVEDVSYGQEWIDNLSIFLKSVKKVGWIISAVLIFGCFFVVGFSVYAVLARRREEIEIYELCGATPSMIQRPFVVEAAILSLVAAIIAVFLSRLVLMIENQFFISQMKYLGFNDLFEFASLSETLIFMVLATMVGATVALFCVRQINTGWAQAEREALR